MHEYTPIVSSLFDMIVLYYWRREGKGRYGNNTRTGVAVSEEMKGAVRFGRAWIERGREEGGGWGIERGRMKEGNEGGKEAGKEVGR